MIYDRHSERQSKWNKAFWERGYYIVTICNVTEATIKKRVQEQSDEFQQKESEVIFWQGK